MPLTLQRQVPCKSTSFHLKGLLPRVHESAETVLGMIFKISLWSLFRFESWKILLEIFGVLPFTLHLLWTGTTLSALDIVFFILKNFPFVVYSSWSLEHSGLMELGWQQAPGT